MKGLIFATLLAISGSAVAADFSAVGSSGIEGLIDYNYTRNVSVTPWNSEHQLLTGLQLNLDGFGSLAVEGGDTQRVTDFRLNYTTFAVTYANGVKIGKLAVVGGVEYAELTGDKWVLSGKNSSLPISNGTGTLELNYAVAPSVKLFTDIGRSVSWSGNINSFYKNEAVVKSSGTDVGTVGAYWYVTKRLELTAGYARYFGNGNQQGLVSEISYSF